MCMLFAEFNIILILQTSSQVLKIHTETIPLHCQFMPWIASYNKLQHAHYSRIAASSINSANNKSCLDIHHGKQWCIVCTLQTVRKQ